MCLYTLVCGHIITHILYIASTPSVSYSRPGNCLKSLLMKTSKLPSIYSGEGVFTNKQIESICFSQFMAFMHAAYIKMDFPFFPFILCPLALPLCSPMQKGVHFHLDPAVPSECLSRHPTLPRTHAAFISQIHKFESDIFVPIKVVFLRLALGLERLLAVYRKKLYYIQVV